MQLEFSQESQVLFDGSDDMIAPSSQEFVPSSAFHIDCDRCLHDATGGEYPQDGPHTCTGPAPTSPQRHPQPTFDNDDHTHNPWQDSPPQRATQGVEHMDRSLSLSPLPTAHCTQDCEEEDAPLECEHELAKPANLNECVDKVVAEVGRIFKARVYNHTELWNMFASKSLPNKPFHTVLRVDVGNNNRPHFAYAKLNAHGELLVNSTSRKHHEHVAKHAEALCIPLRHVLSRRGDINSFARDQFFESLSFSSESAISHLCKALGSRLTFTLDSIVATGSQIKQEAEEEEEEFLENPRQRNQFGDVVQPQTEEDWLHLLNNAVYAPPLHKEDKRGNYIRVDNIISHISKDLRADLVFNAPPNLNTVNAVDQIRQAEFDISETLESIFDGGDSGGHLLLTSQWVTEISSRLPFANLSFIDSVPAYKIQFYTMMANQRELGQR